MRRCRSISCVAGVAVVLCIAVTACEEPTRVATLNDTAQVLGARVATTVQQQLAKQGYPNASVTCVKRIIVNVGPAVSCQLSGAGSKGTVRFTFRTLDGKIDLASIKAS